jgi:signal transduction histidine kinase
VEWLAEHADVRRALVAAVEPEPTPLIGLAGRGLPPSEVHGFSLDLEAEGRLLLSVMSGRRPVAVRHGFRHATPFYPNPFTALPLCAGDDPTETRERVGLLLIDGEQVGPDTQWAADALARVLVRLRTFRRLVDAERRLERERSLLKTIVNAVPDPVLLTDTDGRVLLTNARADSLFAVSDDGSEGRRRAVALNNMLFSAALSQRAIGQGDAARRELLLVNPTEGTDLLYELISAVAHDPREGTGLVSILRNVNDLRRATEEIEENYRRLRAAEAAVRAERDRLDLIIDSVADPILVTEPSGAIVLMNAPAERLFTVDPRLNEEAQRTVRANDARFSSFMSNLFLSGSEPRFRGELQLIDPATSAPVPVEAVAGKVLSSQGELTAVVTILHDQTEALEKARLYDQVKRGSEELAGKVHAATAELLERNEQLKRQALELEQASLAKSQFLANVSHEFRTPLNAILGYTSMLIQGMGGDLNGMQRKQLARVDSNGRHLMSIINDVLDISRIESGRMPVHVAPFDLGGLIAEVFLEVEPVIARSKLDVSREVPPDLQPMASDRQKVKQIVLNLLTNALKFTPSGTVRVRAYYDSGRDELSVAVSDTGVGIAASDRERVFEEFRQADNAPRPESTGTGLGLSICRRLAAALGGRIVLASELGHGSTFTLTLPRGAIR